MFISVFTRPISQRITPNGTQLTPAQGKYHGFTIIELMIGVAILAILTFIAIPSLSSFTVKTRVDNQISELHRLLLTARNTAVNTGINSIVCPISTKCTTSWQNELSAFTDSNGNGDFDAGEPIVKTKAAVKSGDKLQFSQTKVIFSPTGRMTTNAGAFSYCPKDHSNDSRSVEISGSGRVYSSADTDNDGKDEYKNNSDVVCS